MKIEYRKKQSVLTRFCNWFEKSVTASCYLIAVIIHKVNASRSFGYGTLS